VWLYFLDPRVRKIRNDASSCPWIFSTTLRSSIYYVASSPGSPFFLVFGVRVVILLLTNSKVREYQNVLFRSHFQQLDADVSGERPHRREDLLPHGWRQVLGSCRFCELLCRFFLNLMNGSSPPPETVLPGKVERALRYEFMCKMGGPPDFRYCNGEWCKHVENVSLFCFVSILRPHIFKHKIHTNTHQWKDNFAWIARNMFPSSVATRHVAHANLVGTRACNCYLSLNNAMAGLLLCRW